MRNKMELFLKQLSTARDEEELIWLDGYLLRGTPDCVRFVTGHLFLDFDKNDVVIVEERGHGEVYAVPVRIAVLSGGAVRNIGSSEPFERLIGKGRVPFAIAARESTKYTCLKIEDRLSNFTAQERRFLKKYGLMASRRG